MESELLNDTTVGLNSSDPTTPSPPSELVEFAVFETDTEGRSSQGCVDGAIITDLDIELSEEVLYILRIPLTSEMRHELDAVISRRNWERQEGLVNVLASGISQLSAQDREAAPASEEISLVAGQTRLDPLTQELAYYHAMYSAMKFRAFSLLEKLKVLEMREKALKGKLDLGTRWAEATRQQQEALRSENAQLKQRIAELERDSATGSENRASQSGHSRHGRHGSHSSQGDNGGHLHRPPSLPSDGRCESGAGRGLLGKLQTFFSN